MTTLGHELIARTRPKKSFRKLMFGVLDKEIGKTLKKGLK
jgi:hypothetical protein